MRKRIKKISTVLSILVIASTLYGCDNSKTNGESTSSESETIVTTSSTDTVTTTIQTTVIETKATESIIEKDNSAMKYITYSDKTVADVLNDFKNAEPYNGDKPNNYRGNIGQGISWICPEEGVWFFFNPDDGPDYDMINVSEVWIENAEIINKILSNSVKSPNSSETYYAEVDNTSYELYACSDFLTVMKGSNNNGGNAVPQEAPTENTSSNSYGIYVTGNTDLAKLAGNTLIDKKSCPWFSDYCYGYVFINGDSDNDGTYSSYSDVTVAVNEDPNYPYSGNIVITATRTTNGNTYPLKVTYDWEATDYGDYYTFNWYNQKIHG